MIEDKTLQDAVDHRYGGWGQELGSKIEGRRIGFSELEAYILANGEPKLQSGRQEMLENLLNDYI